MIFYRLTGIVLVVCALLMGSVHPVSALDVNTPNSTDSVENTSEESLVPVIPTRSFVKGQISGLDKMVRDFYLGESKIDELVEDLAEKEEVRNRIVGEISNLESRLSEEKKDLDDLNAEHVRVSAELDRLKAKMRNLALGLYMAQGNSLSALTLTQKEDGSAAASQTASIGISGLRRDWSEKSDETKRIEATKKDLEQKVLLTDELVRSTKISLKNIDEQIVAVKQNMVDESYLFGRLLENGLVKQQEIITSLKSLGSPAKKAENPLLTVMGESVLTPEEIVFWYSKDRGSLIVGEHDVAALARLYVEEGNRIGVRGDVAFMQAVLETGNFRFTGKNNYAGIGHCDDCQRGYPYETPTDGVRAQMQLLRGYADRTVTNDSLPWESLPGVGVDKLGVKGCCYTWWGLSGTWASALHYGGTILSMYEQALVVNGKPAIEPPSVPLVVFG